MTDKLTLEQLQDETVLWQEVIRVINPRPAHGYGHEWVHEPACICGKCGLTQEELLLPPAMRVANRMYAPCEQPDDIHDPWADAAELLLRKVPFPDVALAAGEFFEIDLSKGAFELLALVYERFIRATPADRCRVCLLALQAGRGE